VEIIFWSNICWGFSNEDISLERAHMGEKGEFQVSQKFGIPTVFLKLIFLLKSIYDELVKTLYYSWSRLM
jgi:hypothetical protein